MNSINLRFKLENFLVELESYFFDNIFNSNKQSTIKDKLNEILELLNQDKQITDKFIYELPFIKKQIEEDIGFFMISDPAIKSINELIICYLSFKAIWIYRISHSLNNLNVKILPRLLSEYAHMISGIDIHPASKIGYPFFIDHGTGVVIGETTQIGHHVKLYQGVTLGTKNFKNIKNKKRHPTLGNYVTVYADAKILGGNTFIKDYSIIKCNQIIAE